VRDKAARRVLDGSQDAKIGLLTAEILSFAADSNSASLGSVWKGIAYRLDAVTRSETRALFSPAKRSGSDLNAIQPTV
jgi:hypothetical protein